MFDLYQDSHCSGVEAQPLGFNPNPLKLRLRAFTPFPFFPCTIFDVWDALVTSCDVRTGRASGRGWSCMQCANGRRTANWETSCNGKHWFPMFSFRKVTKSIFLFRTKKKVQAARCGDEAMSSIYESCWMVQPKMRLPPLITFGHWQCAFKEGRFVKTLFMNLLVLVDKVNLKMGKRKSNWAKIHFR